MRGRTENTGAAGARRQAGELLAVEAIDRTGLLIRSDGGLVRIVQVTPPNPLVLGADERERIADGYCQLISRLRPAQSVQFYVQATPVRLHELIATARAQVAFFAGEPPVNASQARDRLALSRWRLWAAMQESLEMHASEQAAVQVTHYLVCPHLPLRRGVKGMFDRFRVQTGRFRAPLARSLSAHRRVCRESLASVEALRGELEALGLATRMCNGEEVARLLWSRFNPSVAERTMPRQTEILGELDRPVDQEQAREAARRLRELIAASAVDFRGSPHHVEVDRDIEQTICTSGAADATRMGWLMGAMMTREPFTLSVHVRSLDRGRERRRLKMSYRRTFSVNRGAESRGRVPDFDRYQQEREQQHLLTEMAGHERAGIYEVSIYQTVRVKGPEPDRAALAEAIDYCAEQIHSSSDAPVNRGAFQQRQLWPAGLPLGDDGARRRCRYATRNAGDCVPLIGTGCGSPTGIPFAFSNPGRTLELLDPYDRAHNNSTLLICGESGSGKTTTANKIIAGCTAYGARRVWVIDRSGHYETLTRLIDGARQLQIGSDSSPFAINPWDVPDAAGISREKVSFLIALHATMMGRDGLDALERSQLGAAIREVYARAVRDGICPRESILREVLLARCQAEHADGAVEVAATLRSLAERLGEFCDEGAYAYLLDRETSVPADSPLVVFDTRSCPEAVIGPVMFAIVEYVQRQITSLRQQTPPPAGTDGPLFPAMAVLLIEECWHLLSSRDGGRYVNDLARRARHLGLFLMVVSQLLSDFSGEHGLALLRNCSQMMMLKLPASEAQFAEQTLGLSAESGAILRRLKTVKGSHAELYWINGTRGQGRVTLRLGPIEYWCYTSEPLQDVPAREQMLACHDGEAWQAIDRLAHPDGHEERS